MLPRLQAEEQLAAVEAAALGSGALRKRDQLAALGRLQRAADPDRKVVKASPMMLQQMGIAIVEAPPGRAADNG